MRSIARTTMIIVLLAVVSGAGSAIAQSLWLEPQAGKGIALEFLPPAFKDAEFSTFTRTLYLSTRLATNEKARFMFEFGVRVPTAPEDNDAILVGAFSDYVDRFDFWRPGIQFRVPLDDDLNEFLEPTIGLSIGYDFG